MNADPIVVEQPLSTNIEDAWSLITDPAKMRSWFFEQIESFEPVVGFETRFTVHFEGTDYVHHWRVLVAKKPNQIEYDWLYDGVTGHSKVCWELSESETGTTLRLTHSGGHTFPQDDVAFTRESCEGGWKYFICDRLKHLVESKNQ